MSSWIGHALGGLIAARGEARRSRAVALAAIALSIAPDIDMILPIPDKPRWTHSPFFVTLVPFLVWVVWIRVRPAEPRRGALLLSLIGACASHVVLDMLVGVNRYVLAWPFDFTELGLPFGLLPSAPAPSLTNRFFYRNLAIELAILGPAFIFAWRPPERWAARAGLIGAATSGIVIAAGLAR